MRSQNPPIVATWLLENLRSGKENESLTGDLVEGYRRGRSNSWYWRQVLAAIAISLYSEVRSHGFLAIKATATGWLAEFLFLSVVVRLLIRFHLWLPLYHDLPLFLGRSIAGSLAWLILWTPVWVSCGWFVARLYRSHLVGMVLAFSTSVLAWRLQRLPWTIHLLFNTASDRRYFPQLVVELMNLILPSVYIALGGLIAVRSKRHRSAHLATVGAVAIFAVGVSAFPLRAQPIAGPILPGTANVRDIRAQSQEVGTVSTADRPTFDAASIKKSNSTTGVGRIDLTHSGGHVTATNVSLKFLIIQAYQLGNPRFGSDPPSAGWIGSEHFDVEAEAEGNPTVEQKRLMIQSLLADRFKVRMHHETRQLPEYALVLSKAGKLGPQLRPHSDNTKCVEVPAGQPNPRIVPGEVALPPCGGLRLVGDSLIGQNVTTERLAQTLSILTGPVEADARNVVDRTGLAGGFDLTLVFQPIQPASTPTDLTGPPSIFTALQEQLGLKLESTTGPVDVLVLDHVEEPSPN